MERGNNTLGVFFSPKIHHNVLR